MRSFSDCAEMHVRLSSRRQSSLAGMTRGSLWQHRLNHDELANLVTCLGNHATPFGDESRRTSQARQLLSLKLRFDQIARTLLKTGKAKVMQHIIRWSLPCALLACLLGCDPPPQSGKGFTLPEGDVERGKEAFVALLCHSCHDVSGVELPEIELESDTEVTLGGEVTRIRTYGELVTSIINPSHKLASGYKPEDIATDGQSKMANYNDAMRVQELIDLVAFLQSRYTLRPQVPTEYPMLY